MSPRPDHRRLSDHRKEFTPLRGVELVDDHGIVRLTADSVSVNRVGIKAWGLCCLPAEWTPPLVVIDAALGHRSEMLSTILRALQNIGIEPQSNVIVRSSGVRETLPQRGSLPSKVCKAAAVLEAIQSLQGEIGAEGEVVHWVVQPFHEARALGHLSNERRLSYEKRDWIAEIEPRAGRKGIAVSVAIRRWRDGERHITGPITCSSDAQITVRLKAVAAWAMGFSDRMHFEWLWDGNKLWIVQADQEETEGGVDPRNATKVEIANIEVGVLQAFRVSSPSDFANYRKLKNANTYSELGYTMPSFYILSDTASIAQILAGQIPDPVRADLTHLTARPLIIRTDGRDIPAEKREMLPRSDELRSEEEAVAWLTEQLVSTIAAVGLSAENIVLIAHHFIPAVASAWARAEPGNPHVRVEALWGVPEGLYWYSHDTYQVDTRVGEIVNSERPRGTFSLSKRIRHKGSFVAPDEHGAFVHRTTRAPCDWIPAIRKEHWLSEIAWTTRRVAEREGTAIALMWFVDTHSAASPHAVLPWFHDSSRLAESPRAAPRNKYRHSSEFRIETEGDWQHFQDELRSNHTIERVVVEPIDPSLVRNPVFAEQLATLAKDSGIVVELSGGILSHAFYVLTRAGAKVECVDLFGEESDILEFDKLIRDRIPEGIASRGEVAETVRLSGDALVLALQQKIVEESMEVLDAVSGEEMLGELADVFEVADALAKAVGADREQINEAQADKRSRRGGFDSGIMLIRTATPGTLSAAGAIPADAELDVGAEAVRSISDPALLPLRPTYRKPDLRQIEDSSLEKLLTIEIDIARLADSLKEILAFTLPGARGADETFSVSLELRRQKGALRAVVRLRRYGAQLTLPI